VTRLALHPTEPTTWRNREFGGIPSIAPQSHMITTDTQTKEKQ
jgi:hypothetical protein